MDHGSQLRPGRTCRQAGDLVRLEEVEVVDGRRQVGEQLSQSIAVHAVMMGQHRRGDGKDAAATDRRT